ncbi:MAG TPA: LacI family DNA-binding transcriptional regulator [Anaerolineae bacterium]|nr:LacI family DNA-binding transcriptional regulator [Anaerolineae bacterium]
MSTKQAHPSLVEVARRAGVSPSTVSRVLNKTAPVSEDVRKQVMRAAEELGYQHVPHRSIKAPPLNSIALLIPDILNPFFAEIVRGVQDESADEYMPLLMDTAEDLQREKQYFRLLTAQSVSGVIVGGSRIASEELAAAISYQKIPMVVLNRPVRHPHVACVMVDFEIATYRAACHLLSLNHTRIAYLAGPSQSEASRARRRGVERALSEAMLPLQPELCPVSFPGVDGGFQAMSALLTLPAAERPTAVLAYNDLMALGALHAIRTYHLHVPEDISVIGIDDISMAAHTNPPLTTIAQPKYRMGRVAMRILRQMINGQPPPEEGYTLMESPLIVRESTGPAPITTSNGSHA